MYTEQFVRFTCAADLTNAEWDIVNDWLTNHFDDVGRVDVVSETPIANGLVEMVLGYDGKTDCHDYSLSYLETGYHVVHGVPVHVDSITSYNGGH